MQRLVQGLPVIFPSSFLQMKCLSVNQNPKAPWRDAVSRMCSFTSRHRNSAVSESWWIVVNWAAVSVWWRRIRGGWCSTEETDKRSSYMNLSVTSPNCIFSLVPHYTEPPPPPPPSVRGGGGWRKRRREEEGGRGSSTCCLQTLLVKLVIPRFKPSHPVGACWWKRTNFWNEWLEIQNGSTERKGTNTIGSPPPISSRTHGHAANLES